MRTSRLFKIIWRINSILILLVGVMTGGVLAYVGYTIYKEQARRYASDVVNIAPDADASAEWRLGNFARIDGTNYLVAPAYSKQTYAAGHIGSYSSAEKSASATRNYLFVNADDKSSHWLVKTNDQLFLRSDDIGKYETMNSDDKKPAKWTEYQVVKSDSSRDERLTAKDKITYAISDVTGTNYKEMLTDIAEILGSKLRDENTLLLFYRTADNRSFVAEINLPQQRVTVTKDLPPVRN